MTAKAEIKHLKKENRKLKKKKGENEGRTQTNCNMSKTARGILKCNKVRAERLVENTEGRID